MIARTDVENVLLRIGIPARNKGFKYITDAILFMDGKENCRMTKELYPAVAKINKTTGSRVERSIRHSFDVARSPKGNYEEVEKYIGFMNCENGNSLKMLYTRLRHEASEKESENTRKSNEISEDRIRRIVREELKAIMGGIS